MRGRLLDLRVIFFAIAAAAAINVQKDAKIIAERRGASAGYSGDTDIPGGYHLRGYRKMVRGAYFCVGLSLMNFAPPKQPGAAASELTLSINLKPKH